ncbi:MAG: glutaminyl-peptide cyclotransferase [Chloroflexota bacterium]
MNTSRKTRIIAIALVAMFALAFALITNLPNQTAEQAGTVTVSSLADSERTDSEGTDSTHINADASCTNCPPMPTPTLTPTETSTGTPTPAPTNTSTPLPTISPSVTIEPTAAPTALPITQYTYRVVNDYPHDPDAFTQGLIYIDGILYEGTGLRGRSSLRRVDLESGKVEQQIDLAQQFFGEGITLFNDRMIQLTWQSNTGFVYTRDTFDELQRFSYPTEGWGITHDGERLIMSDGSSSLFFLDPETFENIGQVAVRDNSGPVRRINELEYIDGQVFGNIWQTDRIIRIDPNTGNVTASIDLTGLFDPAAYGHTQPYDVLNGIAYDPNTYTAETPRLLVTGKLWPRLFEIELVER